MIQLDKENRAQCNQDTPRHSFDCNLVSSAGSGGRRARARPRARPRSVVVGSGTCGGSRGRERGIVDRGGCGDTDSRSAILDREIVTGDRVAKLGGGDVGSEVEELYARVGRRSGWGGEA